MVTCTLLFVYANAGECLYMSAIITKLNSTHLPCAPCLAQAREQSAIGEGGCTRLLFEVRSAKIWGLTDATPSNCVGRHKFRDDKTREPLRYCARYCEPPIPRWRHTRCAYLATLVCHYRLRGDREFHTHLFNYNTTHMTCSVCGRTADHTGRRPYTRGRVSTATRCDVLGLALDLALPTLAAY